MSADEKAARQTWSGEFSVAPDHPCLPGHFPGEAIVPAVLLLELSCAVLRQQCPALGPPREVKSAKFMLPVRPGETVRVTFSRAGAAGALHWRCETAGGIAAQGQMLFTAAA